LRGAFQGAFQGAAEGVREGVAGEGGVMFLAPALVK
jgi:hypothetical protein